MTIRTEAPGVPEQESTVTPSESIQRKLLDNLAWAILLVVGAGFSIFVDGFFGLSNFANIVSQSVFIGILAIAFAIPLIAGKFDLSIESTAALSALVGAWLAGSSIFASGFAVNPFVVLAISLSMGLAVGAVNAFLIIRLNIDSFLVTLSMFIIVRGIAVTITSGKGSSNLPSGFTVVESTQIFGMPLTVYIVLGLFGLFGFILNRTQFGRHLYVVGGNPQAAFNFGVNVKRVLLTAFLISGSLAALSGWLLAARSNGAFPAVATGFLFQAIAAVVIGGVALRGGAGSTSGVLGGVLLLAAITNALTLSRVSPFVVEVIRGGLVLVAVVIDALKRKVR